MSIHIPHFCGRTERTDGPLRSHPAKQNPVKRAISLILLVLMLVSIVTPVFAGGGTDAYVNLDTVNVRTGPGTGYATVKFGSSGITLSRGQYVRIIATQRGSDGYDWHQVVFTYRGYSKVGFMRSDFIGLLGDDSAYRAYLDEQGFPKSYQPYLRALHAASGGLWNFVADKTELDWTRALENEATLGRALISGSDTALRSTASGSYNSETGEWWQFETGWYAANTQTVAYYLDPRSYLADGHCIAFELLSGSAAATSEQVAKVLKDCAWATDALIDEFVQAGKEANVSAIYLAVKARGEIGTGNTSNASGYTLKEEDGGGVYYNFFNVGAYGGSDPNYNGILYARDHDWDTSYKALVGGAKFIYDNYIEPGQNTQYLQRFNLTKTGTFGHQYATDITYAYKGGGSTYKSYKTNNLLDVSLVLSVPILEDMPSVTKLPVTGYNDYVSDLNLVLTDSYLSGFAPGTPAMSIPDQIKAANPSATVSVTGSNEQAVADDALIGTGQVLFIQDGTDTMTYTCVVYGDVNGDGRIAATDLLAVKKHILGTQPLSGAYARAATLSGGKIAATSLLAIKKHILGTAPIAQK